MDYGNKGCLILITLRGRRNKKFVRLCISKHALSFRTFCRKSQKPAAIQQVLLCSAV